MSVVPSKYTSGFGVHRVTRASSDREQHLHSRDQLKRAGFHCTSPCETLGAMGRAG